MMKYVLSICAALLLYAAVPAENALACEGCLRAKEKEPTQVACIVAPDGPGEICTSGGGYCNEEGSCKKSLVGDGSLLPADAVGQFAIARNTREELVRRACDEGVIHREYVPQRAERMRAQSSSLTI
jgi:hypothetical protein